jgi:hypothetical protein
MIGALWDGSAYLMDGGGRLLVVGGYVSQNVPSSRSNDVEPRSRVVVVESSES